MGLDQYAYAAAKAGAQNAWYEGATFDEMQKDYVNPNANRPLELAYWRKHPNLQGWMEQLAQQKGLEYKTFNGVELELTREDLDRLEQDILAGALPTTRGFFFGDNSDEYYRDRDLEFVRLARAELFMGLRVFYNSSW
jgi:hypothetical protein